MSVPDWVHPSPNVIFEHDYHRGRSVEQFLSHLRNYITYTQDILEVIGVSTYERMGNIAGMYCVRFRRNQETQRPDLVSITSFGRENLHPSTIQAIQNYFLREYPAYAHPVLIRGRGRTNPATLLADPPCDILKFY